MTLWWDNGSAGVPPRTEPCVTSTVRVTPRQKRRVNYTHTHELGMNRAQGEHLHVTVCVLAGSSSQRQDGVRACSDFHNPTERESPQGSGPARLWVLLPSQGFSPWALSTPRGSKQDTQKGSETASLPALDQLGLDSLYPQTCHQPILFHCTINEL